MTRKNESLKVVMKFIAKNPPSILILLGGLGWLLQGLGIGIFVGYAWFVVVGVILQLIWMALRYNVFKSVRQ
jgi:hypothetical protein